MKIKLLKDIPGFKAGEIADLENYDLIGREKPNTLLYSARNLIRDGWAEEVKDDEHNCETPGCTGEVLTALGQKTLCEYNEWFKETISKYIPIIETGVDIEEIRKDLTIKEWHANTLGGFGGDDFSKWISAYLVVKAVIEKLNGDWKPDWSNIDLDKWTIMYNHEDKHFMVNDNQYFECTFWYLKDQDTTKKVISLCEPEIKVLFGVK